MTEPSQYFKGRTVQEQMNEVIGYVDTRAAEVATDAIAADVAQVHQDMLDADADAQAAAASAAAAAGMLSNAVKKTGESSQSIAGDIAVSGDLSAGGDLTVTGGAGIQGNLSVIGTVDLRGTTEVPNTTTGVSDKKAVNGNRLQADLAAYSDMVRIAGDQVRTGTLASTTAGSSSASATKDVPARFNTKSSGFVRTAQQGVSRHYPIACLVDSNGDTVCKLQVSTSDTSIQVYLQAVAIDGTTQATKVLGTFDRSNGTWS